MLKPVFTEKSLKLAKEGRYSFWVTPGMNKNSIKSEIARIFGVTVVDINTTSVGGERGRNARGRNYVHLRTKKAIVTLKDKEKIDIFEEAKK